MIVLGVDFTSAPRRAKPIVVASGRPTGPRRLRLERVEEITLWGEFEALLARPGPWIGGFDFPFGLPREAIDDLGWPTDWDRLVEHCAALGRAGFRARLDAHRSSRPVGNRYAHRATDRPAASHSPLKLVNPPVGLMFLEGAPRLLRAGVTIPRMREGDPLRIAVEAYPGFTARTITRDSYKADDRARQTRARSTARARILSALCEGSGPAGLALEGAPALLRSLVEDPSGDRLDAAIAALQALWCWSCRRRGFGLPATTDPCEGWIACVPPPRRPA